MAEIISLEDLKKSVGQSEILALFKRKPRSRSNGLERTKTAPDFPSSRPGISGNLSDLFEQANAVAMRHYDGDPRVPGVVAEKCIELLQALANHARPE